MKARYLSIPIVLASSLFLGACIGGQDSPDNTEQTQSQSNGINGNQPKETKTADPNDPNQGRDVSPIEEPDFTAPAGSAYDTSEKGTGVDKSKDAGDAASADEIMAPIKNGGIGTQAGVAVVYNGKDFPASTPVNIKILTVDGTDTGVVVESASTDAGGNLSARVYLPKNLSNGSYEVSFNAGSVEQKTKIDLMSGF